MQKLEFSVLCYFRQLGLVKRTVVCVCVCVCVSVQGEYRLSCTKRAISSSLPRIVSQSTAVSPCVCVCVVGKGTAFFFPLQSFEVKTLPYVSGVRDRW